MSDETLKKSDELYKNRYVPQPEPQGIAFIWRGVRPETRGNRTRKRVDAVGKLYETPRNLETDKWVAGAPSSQTIARMKRLFGDQNSEYGFYLESNSTFAWLSADYNDDRIITFGEVCGDRMGHTITKESALSSIVLFNTLEEAQAYAAAKNEEEAAENQKAA